MWWDIRMDQDGEVMLSCAPYWAHPDLAGELQGFRTLAESGL